MKVRVMLRAWAMLLVVVGALALSACASQEKVEPQQLTGQVAPEHERHATGIPSQSAD